MRKLGVVDKEHLYLRKIVRLNKVTQHLQENSKTKVSNQTDPKVIYDLIISTIENWHHR